MEIKLFSDMAKVLTRNTDLRLRDLVPEIAEPSLQLDTCSGNK